MMQYPKQSKAEGSQIMGTIQNISDREFSFNDDNISFVGLWLCIFLIFCRNVSIKDKVGIRNIPPTHTILGWSEYFYIIGWDYGKWQLSFSSLTFPCLAIVEEDTAPERETPHPWQENKTGWG